MNLNLDEPSPWFHVHFTLPNQGNKRSDIKYDSQRKRIKDLIQNKDTFLAPTCQRGNLSRPGANNKPVKKSEDESKRKIDEDSSTNFTLSTPWLNQNSFSGKSSDTQKKVRFIEKRMFIDNKASNTTKEHDGKSILPPLEGRKAGVITCCPGQQDKITETKTDKDEVKNTDQRIETKTENNLSIADCYDLCNWKPQTSLCKKARPLVSILKQNTKTPRPQQGQGSIPSDSSESSGNETENGETTKKCKKVRFAKGTKFSPSTRSRKYRKKRNHLDSKFESDKELSGGENLEENLEDMIELSFREFIQRKRQERSKVMAEISRDSNMLYFLKEETKLPKVNTTRRQQHRQQSKRNGVDQENRGSKGSKVDTLLPAVVN